MSLSPVRNDSAVLSPSHRAFLTEGVSGFQLQLNLAGSPLLTEVMALWRELLPPPLPWNGSLKRPMLPWLCLLCLGPAKSLAWFLDSYLGEAVLEATHWLTWLIRKGSFLRSRGAYQRMTSGKEWPGLELWQKLWILPVNTLLSFPAVIPKVKYRLHQVLWCKLSQWFKGSPTTCSLR